jgi:hypothetical protein
VIGLSKELQPANNPEADKSLDPCERPTDQSGGPSTTRNLKCLQNRRGLALIVTVLVLIPVGCLAALFLDAGRVYAVRAGMQAAADATVLAAASGLIDGNGDSVQARAEEYVAMNPIHATPALLESLYINTDLGTVRIVLKYQTGALFWAPGGLTVRMDAGAKAEGVRPGEIGRPIPNGNAFGWWKNDKFNPGSKDSGVVRLAL